MTITNPWAHAGDTLRVFVETCNPTEEEVEAFAMQLRMGLPVPSTPEAYALKAIAVTRLITDILESPDE